MRKNKFAVLNFPGSNCEKDCHFVIEHILKQDCKYIWHEETDINNVDCIIIPGGFSYGDYLRTGSIAAQSKIAKSLKKYSRQGGTIIGICNGFQILTELKLLPGTLLRNHSLNFICKEVNLVVNNKSRFTSKYNHNQVVKVPIAHAEGNYFASSTIQKELIKNNQIIFSYCDKDGNINNSSNPNGSLNGIAGIRNKEGNVLGMMPHPERVSEKVFGNIDGLGVFESILDFHKN